MKVRTRFKKLMIDLLNVFSMGYVGEVVLCIAGLIDHLDRW